MSFRRRTSIIHGLPSFGLIASIVFGSVVAVLMLHHALMPTTKGIHVWLAGARILGTNAFPIKESIIVRIDSQERLFLNSVPCAVPELGPELRKMFSTRRDWIVYIEGADDIPFADVAVVADTVHNLHARPVLLTPKSQRN